MNKVQQSQQVLSQLQSAIVSALDSFQKPRDLQAIKVFFPQIDTSTAMLPGLLSNWPDYDSLSDADQKAFGSFLSQFSKAIFTKIQSKA